MMPRPKTPDGRRVPVSFKISEPEAALVDSLRGDKERGAWLRDAALAVAREQHRRPPARPGRGQQVIAGAPAPKAAAPPPPPPVRPAHAPTCKCFTCRPPK